MSNINSDSFVVFLVYFAIGITCGSKSCHKWRENEYVTFEIQSRTASRVYTKNRLANLSLCSIVEIHQVLIFFISKFEFIITLSAAVSPDANAPIRFDCRNCIHIRTTKRQSYRCDETRIVANAPLQSRVQQFLIASKLRAEHSLPLAHSIMICDRDGKIGFESRTALRC